MNQKRPWYTFIEITLDCTTTLSNAINIHVSWPNWYFTVSLRNDITKSRNPAMYNTNECHMCWCTIQSAIAAGTRCLK